ncbi:unnamed protein product [Aureobasidium vineae]|uniref:BTB domain-containing protein n=1 Tax=Aureobasidium vineae TaxID=2773715 RepID=A0A9N8JUD9_9PEZI|nr:unnamed protein product [Aureobasidium vineae]
MSFRESISDRPATIKVGRGPHAGVFTVQKALLCNSSAYFTAALNGTFIEGETQTINLDDEDPTIFRTYVAWLYQGQLNSQDIEGALDDPQNFGQHIAELIVFADKRDISELKNDAISMLLSYLYKNGLAALDKPEFMAEIIKISKSIEGRSCVRVLSERSFEQGDLNICKLVHSHIHQAQGCSSFAKNTYMPAPPVQEPPNKKRKVGPSTLTVELLDD